MEGVIALQPEIANREPLYSLDAFARPMCDPSKIPPLDEGHPLHDFGQWTLDGTTVRFRSSEEFGNYSVPAEYEVAGRAGLFLRLRLGGTEYLFRRDRVFGQD